MKEGLKTKISSLSDRARRFLPWSTLVPLYRRIGPGNTRIGPKDILRKKMNKNK
jgi:hypothetical protein